MVNYDLTEQHEITWAEMERLQKTGLTDAIGLSNFNRRKTLQLLKRNSLFRQFMKDEADVQADASIKPVVNRTSFYQRFVCSSF